LKPVSTSNQVVTGVGVRPRAAARCCEGSGGPGAGERDRRAGERMRERVSYEIRRVLLLIGDAEPPRPRANKLAINSPSRLGNLEGVLGSFECGKARWGKGFRSLTSKLTR